MSKLLHWAWPILMMLPLRAQEAGDTLVFAQPDVIVKASALMTQSARSATFSYSLADSQLRSLSGMPVDRILRRSGLVYVRDRGGRSSVVTVGLRGYAATQTSVTLNGFPLVNEQNGLIDMGLYPPDIIGGISIVRGAQSVFAGSGGVGGLIQLRTPDATSRRWEVKAAGGSYGYRSAAARIPLAGAGLPVIVRAGVIADDGAFPYDIISGYDRYTGIRRGNQSRMVYGLGESNVALSSTTAVSAIVYAVDLSRGSPGAVSLRAGSEATLKDQMVRGGARVVSRFGDLVWEWQAGAEYQVERYDDPSPLLPVSDRYSNAGLTASARVHAALSSSLAVTGGVDLSRHVIDASTLRFPEGSSRVAAYALFSWIGPSERTLIYPSVRYDVFSDLTPIPSWKLALHQVLVGGRVLTLRLGVGSGFRVPSFNERFWRPGGNPLLRHESSVLAEGGLSSGFAVWGDHEVSVLGSYSVIRDRIVGWPPLNAERTRQIGLEASWSWHPDPAVMLQAAGAYADVQSLVPALPGKQFPYIPRLTASAGAQVSMGGVEFSGAAEYASRRYTTTDNLTAFSSAPYTVVSGAVSCPFTLFGPLLRLTAVVDNVFDVSYEIVKDYPLPGRSFTFTFTLEIDS